MAKLFANSGDPDQTPHVDLRLHCLPVSHLGVIKLKWDNGTFLVVLFSFCIPYSIVISYPFLSLRLFSDFFLIFCEGH